MGLTHFHTELAKSCYEPHLTSIKKICEKNRLKVFKQHHIDVLRRTTLSMTAHNIFNQGKVGNDCILLIPHANSILTKGVHHHPKLYKFQNS